MVLIWTIPGTTIKGDDVEGIRVSITSCDLPRHIVIGIEYPATTLSRQHLERQVPEPHLVWRLHPVQELLIKYRLETARVLGPERVDGVKSNASLPEFIRKTHN